MSDALSLHKFIVALSRDDAVTVLSAWLRYPEMKEVLSGSDVFDSADAARARRDHLVEQADIEGDCEPGHACGRCANWPPQVWDLTLSVRPVN